jgi:hypothetical protein
MLPAEAAHAMELIVLGKMGKINMKRDIEIRQEEYVDGR